MIGKALGNMIGEAVGDAMKQTVDTLKKEDGMPGFLADEIKKMVEEKIGELKDDGVDCDCQQQVNDDNKDWKQDFVADLVKQMLKNVRDNLDAEAQKQTGRSKGGVAGSGGGSGGGSSGAGGASAAGGAQAGGQAAGGANSAGGSGSVDGAGSGSGEYVGSWLEAIAKAMGEMLGKKAARLVELSNKMAKLGKEGEALKGADRSGGRVETAGKRPGVHPSANRASGRFTGVQHPAKQLRQRD